MLKINELLFSKSKSKKSVMCVTTAILEVELILHCLSYSIHHQQSMNRFASAAGVLLGFH